MAQPPNPNRPDAPGNQPQGERLEVPPRLIDAIRQSRRSKVEHGQVRLWIEGPDGTTTTKVYAVPLAPEDLAAISASAVTVSDISLEAEIDRLAKAKAQIDDLSSKLSALKASRE